MSMFREALRAKLTILLRCTRCATQNRPGATLIEIDETGSRAYCTVCRCEGPLATFHQQRA